MKKIKKIKKNRSSTPTSYTPYLRIIEAQCIINSLSEAINNIKLSSVFSDIVEEILKCEGKIIVSGVGKAGLCIKLYSALSSSLGSPSFFISALDSQHGDLGTISKNDILFVASTSGKTREIIELIDLARKIGVKKVIGITSHPDSIIRKKADLVLDMGEITECGYLHLAPTTSIIIMLSLLDSLALVVAKEKGFTKKDYSLRHHGGYLGEVAKK